MLPKFKTNQTKSQAGVSLIAALLLGSIIVTTVASLVSVAVRLFRVSEVRTDVVRVYYGAEDAFACVRYWIKKDRAQFGKDGTIKCNDITYDLNATAGVAGTDTANDGHAPIYTEGSDPYTNTGTTEFRIPHDSTRPNLGGAIVRVIRDEDRVGFSGLVQISSDSEDVDSGRSAQRLLEYEYIFGDSTPADVMFVLDHSRSIKDEDWPKIVSAVQNTVTELKDRVPGVHVGVVTFGRKTYNTAVEHITTECLANGREQNISDGRAPYTDDIYDADANNIYNELRDDSDSTNDPKENKCTLIPNMSLTSSPDFSDAGSVYGGVTGTNMQIGLGVAAAQLMGAYYPISTKIKKNTSIGPPFGPRLDDAYRKGRFEKIAYDLFLDDTAMQLDHADALPRVVDDSGGTLLDRTDATSPDYIILFTDGSPNVETLTLASSTTYSSNPLGSYIGYQYREDLLRECAADDGGEAEYPDADDEDEERSMCAVEAVAYAIKEAGIHISTVFVGDDDDPGIPFLKNYVADSSEAAVAVTSYDDFEEALLDSLDVIDSVSLIESR